MPLAHVISKDQIKARLDQKWFTLLHYVDSKFNEVITVCFALPGSTKTSLPLEVRWRLTMGSTWLATVVTQVNQIGSLKPANRFIILNKGSFKNTSKQGPYVLYGSNMSAFYLHNFVGISVLFHKAIICYLKIDMHLLITTMPIIQLTHKTCRKYYYTFRLVTSSRKNQNITHPGNKRASWIYSVPCNWDPLGIELCSPCPRCQICLSVCLIPEWIQVDLLSALMKRVKWEVQEKNLVFHLLPISWCHIMLLPVMVFSLYLGLFMSIAFWITVKFCLSLFGSTLAVLWSLLDSSLFYTIIHACQFQWVFLWLHFWLDRKCLTCEDFCNKHDPLSLKLSKAYIS